MVSWTTYFETNSKYGANSYVKTWCVFHFSKMHYLVPRRIFITLFFENGLFLMKNVQSQDKAFLLEIIQENSSGEWALRRGLKNCRKRKKAQKCSFSIIFLAFEHLFVVWSRHLYGFFTRSKGKV